MCGAVDREGAVTIWTAVLTAEGGSAGAELTPSVQLRSPFGPSSRGPAPWSVQRALFKRHRVIHGPLHRCGKSTF